MLGDEAEGDTILADGSALLGDKAEGLTREAILDDGAPLLDKDKLCGCTNLEGVTGGFVDTGCAK